MLYYAQLSSTLSWCRRVLFSRSINQKHARNEINILHYCVYCVFLLVVVCGAYIRLELEFKRSTISDSDASIGLKKKCDISVPQKNQLNLFLAVSLRLKCACK